MDYEKIQLRKDVDSLTKQALPPMVEMVAKLRDEVDSLTKQAGDAVKRLETLEMPPPPKPKMAAWMLKKKAAVDSPAVDCLAADSPVVVDTTGLA